MSQTASAVYRRHSFLKRNPQHSRAEFSRYYEHSHGPLAAGLAGFRKFSKRYIQNHVEELPDGREPLFDGVTMTTQVERPDYTRGFFNEPDYEVVKPDEIYLFDIEKTVSVLGREEIAKEGVGSPYKALVLCESQALKAVSVPSSVKLVLNRLDPSTASALGFRSGSFDYDLLAEIWFNSVDARSEAYAAYSRAGGSGLSTRFLPVREVLIFGPEKPWSG